MKPINEMSLAELANKLCDLHEGDTVGRIRIADRLDQIHDFTRWIPVEERLPTGADANERGLVCTYKDGRTGLCFLGENGRPRVWHNGMHEYVCFDNQFTHWRRIDKPGGV